MANSRSRVNESNLAALQEKHSSLYEKVELDIKVDLREQSVAVGELREFFIEQRKLIRNLDKAIVTEM